MTAALEVIRASGLCTIQDGGRPGRMHLGIPPGGPLVQHRLWRANGAVDNAPGDSAIEIVGDLQVKAIGNVLVADDDGTTRSLADGETFTVRSSASSRVRYLSVRGSIDVPQVHGGRGTLLVASMGGLNGRVLRTGDVLKIGSTPTYGKARYVDDAELAPLAVVHVVLGPDEFPEASRDALLSGEYRVTHATDRSGYRLSGPKLTSPVQVRSAPMVLGAIQVPPSGEPIVLGPDHPTTGGYPVIAVVIRKDVGRVFETPPAGTVRFRVR